MRGASFLAFSQAARAHDLQAEAIAISPWAVEEDRAEEFQGVFEAFTFLVRKYDDFASYLRMAPMDALHRFEDGSVDLLSLDGFCAYEELERTLDGWLAKLSDRGVLLLHDTQAHGGDFGVWRIWDELQARFPTLSFRHAEGLGVACVGKHVAPDLVTLAEAVQDDPAL